MTHRNSPHLTHITSPHKQPDCFISPRNRPHDIKTSQIATTAHHHHGTAEGSFTAKKWFGHRAGRSPCAHSIGKFFLCYILLFSSETSAPGSPGNYLYRKIRPRSLSQGQKCQNMSRPHCRKLQKRSNKASDFLFGKPDVWDVSGMRVTGFLLSWFWSTFQRCPIFGRRLFRHAGNLAGRDSMLPSWASSCTATHAHEPWHIQL